ncbi:GTP pyrophosphokinase [Paenibacillus sp. FSL H7-0323]|uniref:GTP pyrophosphokinase n=1 Tax=Paenibacillus sp. FSL H7-0323 TaxID=2921433 RepID=UPI0030FB2B95
MSSIQSKNTEDLKSWYTDNQQTYINLAKKVETIIQELLDAEGVTYYSITSRAKDVDSFLRKSQKDKYQDPKQQIQDLAGIRVITYMRSEVTRACEIIKPLFKIDEKNSVNKSSELGNDKVGYRSVHYVACLTEERLALPEYKMFKDFCFEIQVRTLLEHAWADITHDRSYKFKGNFPPDYDIERRFSLVSATLELVDREFDSIVNTFNKYERETEGKSRKGEYNLPLNATTLENYLQNKLNDQIKRGALTPTFREGESIIIEELLNFGINNIEELDKMVNSMINKNPEIIKSGNNFIGLLRDVMMLTDIDLYFKNAWQNHWQGLGISFIKIAKKIGIDIDQYIDKYELDVHYEE